MFDHCGNLCFQGKSDEALERHLVDLRAQNAELLYPGSITGSGRMQSALIAAVRIASMLSSNQSSDTIQQAMSVLDAVNKKLYGMIDQTPATDSSSKSAEQQRPGEVQPTSVSKSLDSVRGYGDDDDDDETSPFSYGAMTSKRPSSPNRPPPGLGTSSQRSTTGPPKRFRFGL